MSAKQKFVLIAMVIVFTAIGGLIHMVNQDEQDSKQHRREWMEFSQRNHCRLVRESSFWDATNIWQCDGGFQVKRWSNE